MVEQLINSARTVGSLTERLRADGYRTLEEIRNLINKGELNPANGSIKYMRNEGKECGLLRFAKDKKGKQWTFLKPDVGYPEIPRLDFWGENQQLYEFGRAATSRKNTDSGIKYYIHKFIKNKQGDSIYYGKPRILPESDYEMLGFYKGESVAEDFSSVNRPFCQNLQEAVLIEQFGSKCKELITQNPTMDKNEIMNNFLKYMGITLNR